MRGRYHIMAILLVVVFLLSTDFIHSQISAPILGQHTFQPPYLMSYGSGAIPNWEYGGSTIATENYIRLTPAIQSRTGYIYNTQPLMTSNWRVEFRFQIHNSHSPGADGIGFWYVEKPERTSGPLFGQKEYFKGFGVIFDTYDNNANGDGPSVIAVQGHGNANERWDVDNDLLANQLDRCRADFRNAIGGIVTAKITYQNKQLTVELDTLGTGKFSNCLSVSDLSVPMGYYFQLTSATGGLADYHDIYSFVTYELDGRNALTEQTGEGHKKEHPHHGWYDPYEYWRNQAEQEQAADKRNVNREEMDKEDREFFDQLKDKLKHVGDDSSIKGSKSKEDVDISTQTNLLILEALEEVTKTVRSSSTKDDFHSIIVMVDEVTNKQKQLQKDLIETRENVNKEFSTMLDSLAAEAKNLHSGIGKLDSYLNGMNLQIDTLAVKHGQVHHSIEHSRLQITESIKNETNYSFWIFFVLFQVSFVVGFIYYRKYNEVKRSKLF